MTSISAPTLETNLTEGHSFECKRLGLGYYPDLHEDIEATISQTRDVLLEFMDSAFDLVVGLDSLVGGLLLSDNYGEIVARVSEIQRSIRSSSLDGETKQAIWGSIAECYQRVQTALSERIIPLEKRKLLKVGDTEVVPVRVSLDGGRIWVRTELPPFRYAIERHSSMGREYRESLESFSFRDDYFDNLKPEVRNKLLPNGICQLPLKIVSAGVGMLTFAEIDEEAFARMSDLE